MADELDDNIEECVTRLLAQRFSGGSVVLVDPDEETRQELGEAFEEVGLNVVSVGRPSEIPPGTTPSMLLAPFWLQREMQRVRDQNRWSFELILYESGGVSSAEVGLA